MTTLLTLDPGGTTGWAFGEWRDGEEYSVIEHGMIPNGLAGFLNWWSEDHIALDYLDVIVSESFQLRGKVVNPDVTPLRVEGALAVLAPRTIYQQPLMKVHASDAILRAYGLWWPGAGHDRDAARHALAYLKLQGHMPTIRKMGLAP